jgi:hypothetical protein
LPFVRQHPPVHRRRHSPRRASAYRLQVTRVSIVGSLHTCECETFQS